MGITLKTKSKSILKLGSYQDLEYSEPFIGMKGHPCPAHFIYRTEKLFVNFIDETQKLFIPFTGSDKKCRDCGKNRELVIELDLEGNFIEHHDVCDNSKDLKIH